MRADLTRERKRLSDRIAELDALLMFTMPRLAFFRRGDRNATVYANARRMLAERRRNYALDALMALDMAEDSARRERLEYARDNEVDLRIKARKEARNGR